MITKWQLENFKAVSTNTSIDLGPLTVLAGANSSGKSTILQSILLLAQTLSGSGGRFSQREIVLNGHLTRLGQFDDLLSHGSKEREIYIGFECRPNRIHDSARIRRILLESTAASLPSRVSLGHSNIKSVRCDLRFTAPTRTVKPDLSQLQPNLASVHLTSVAIYDEEEDKGDYTSSIRVEALSQRSARIKRERLGAGLSDGTLPPASTEYRVEVDKAFDQRLRIEIPTAKVVGCVLNHFLPQRLIVQFDKNRYEAHIIAAFLTRGADFFLRSTPRAARKLRLTIPIGVLNYLQYELSIDISGLVGREPARKVGELTFAVLLEDWLDWLQRLSTSRRNAIHNSLSSKFKEIEARATQGESTDLGLDQYRLPSGIEEAQTYLTNFFRRQIRYLGPLRDEPRALYPIAANSDPFDVGLRGELTAAVLELNKEAIVTYIRPVDFKSAAQRPAVSRVTLLTAVADWLAYMGVASSVETTDRGRLGHELRVSVQPNGPLHDLTHVGVGVSQVLPILVMCLLAERDTTLLLEQPELHLHPKVQTLLGDFFLSMTFLDKQCIIESHSEYLVNRLRFRAAASSDGLISSKLRIYFAENRESSAVFTPVVVNEYGAITDWPDGFFDQSQHEAEAILRTALAKKRAQRLMPIVRDED